MLAALLAVFAVAGFGGAAATAAAAEHPASPVRHGAPRPLSADAVVHDWVGFLGPGHNGVSSERPLLRDLPPKTVWEMPKGSGYAAPAVAAGRLILFHRVGDEEVVECLAAETGQRHWRFFYPSAYVDRYGYNDGPRASPVIELAGGGGEEAGGGRVYTFGAEAKLHCFDLRTGEVRWKRDLAAEFKLEANFFGVGSTPLLHPGKGQARLIVNVGAPDGPCVAAFDAATGKLIWEASSGTKPGWGPSYAAPVPATIHGKARVLVFAGGESRPPTGGLLCIDPETGRADFAFPHRGRRYESVNASAPLVIGGGAGGGERVFLSECYGAGGVMLRITPEMRPEVLWRSEALATHFMVAVHKDGHLYGFDGHGPLDCPLVCLDASTGKEVWREDPQWTEEFKVPDGTTRRMRFGLNRSHLLHTADGRTLCLTETGHLLWLDLNPRGYRELSRASLFVATETWTPPVLSRGLLYVCQNTKDLVRGTPARIICYDLRG